MTSSKNHRNYLKKIHSITKETLGNNGMSRKGSLAPLEEEI